MLPLYLPTPKDQVGDRLYQTPIPGLWYCDIVCRPDSRGFFCELGLLPDIEQAIGHPFIIKQINHAHSKANVVRGFHAENWNKLVTITRGLVFSALVDVRPNSPTFKQVVTLYLGHNHTALKGCLFISAGIANSVCVVKGPADYFYFVDKLYRDRDANGDGAISLFDPDIQVTWPIDQKKMIISTRDLSAQTLRQKFPSPIVSR